MVYTVRSLVQNGTGKNGCQNGGFFSAKPRNFQKLILYEEEVIYIICVQKYFWLIIFHFFTCFGGFLERSEYILNAVWGNLLLCQVVSPFSDRWRAPNPQEIRLSHSTSGSMAAPTYRPICSALPPRLAHPRVPAPPPPSPPTSSPSPANGAAAHLLSAPKP